MPSRATHASSTSLRLAATDTDTDTSQDAPARRPLIRRVGSILTAPARGVWARCDEQLCRIDGPPNPFAFWSRLMPRRRPLTRLQLCEEGTIKVRTSGELRSFVLHPSESEKDTCSVEDALDLF